MVDHKDIELEELHNKYQKAREAEAVYTPAEVEDENMRSMLLSFMSDKTGRRKRRKAMVIDVHSNKSFNMKG